MSGPTPGVVLGLLSSQLRYCPPLPTASFEGQTVIITGANAGLGREAAKHAVRLNASRVILAVRTVSKGEDAREWIAKETGRKGVCDVWQLDMANFDSVRSFGQRAQGLERLDAALLNAGVWPHKFEKTGDHETTVFVNVIATFLLAKLLLPKMQETAKKLQVLPRMSIVTSNLHKFATLPARKDGIIFEGLKNPLEAKDYDNRYNDTKLLEVVYGQKLAAQLTASGKPKVVLDFPNPGWCDSGLHEVGENIAARAAKRVLQRTSDDGGRILIDSIAPVDRVEERHGQYLDDMKVKPAAAWISSKDGQATSERVWTELNKILDAELAK